MGIETAARLERLREAVQPYGAFTPARAAEFGISRTLLRRYVQNGTLLRNVFERGVYRFDTPAYLESIVDAALLAGAEAVVSHVSALAESVKMVGTGKSSEFVSVYTAAPS
jgi:hypothetical protein